MKSIDGLNWGPGIGSKVISCIAWFSFLITKNDNFEPGITYPKDQLVELFKQDLAKAEKETDDAEGKTVFCFFGLSIAR